MKLTSITARLGSAREVHSGTRCVCRFLHRNNLLVVAQARMQLRRADIDCIDFVLRRLRAGLA